MRTTKEIFDIRNGEILRDLFDKKFRKEFTNNGNIKWFSEKEIRKIWEQSSSYRDFKETLFGELE